MAWTSEQLRKKLASNPQITVDETKAGSIPRRKQYKQKRANALVTKKEGAKESTKRPRVSFTVFRVRIGDPDSNRDIKDLLDGLRYAKLIENDDEKSIDLAPTRRVKVKRKSEERTEIEIEL